MSHPRKVAPNVAIPILMNGSVGTSFVIWSAKSGTSEKAAIAPPVDTMDVTMEEVRAYRRRDWRSRKKAFQSRISEEGRGESAEVDAWRMRHREGVKKDAEVFVEGDGEAARAASLEDDGR